MLPAPFDGLRGDAQASTGSALTTAEAAQVLALVNDPATENELLNDLLVEETGEIGDRAAWKDGRGPR